MATATVTATALGSYSSKVTGMTIVGSDIYHILHGLGATPHEVHVVLRSVHASIPVNLAVSSYSATMALLTSVAAAAGGGMADVVFRNNHSTIL